MKTRRGGVVVAICVLALAIGVGFAITQPEVWAHRLGSYPQLHSANDEDGDSVDDQADILQSARTYIGSKPKYESKYYASGYPDDDCGVCTDVVAFALKGAGYDLQALVGKDISDNPNVYRVTNPDANIDFRRVENQRTYFERHAISLTTRTDSWEDWQGGDIVTFEDHVGIVSDKRNWQGRPFLIHLAPFQLSREEDALERCGTITGHFRISE